MEPETPEETRAKRHEAIRKTVERIAPLQEIDTTKILTDEETALLHAQTAKMRADKKLAAEIGREGLMKRLRQAAQKADNTSPPSRALDPQKLREKLAE